ncbi:MAG: pyridoxal-dependent decarboxylase, partial [Candidatus Omnitrophica bacterium]|nr:pyridoxal-dependent decarboxylase [Candidatus Omnitrophota bacterium]
NKQALDIARNIAGQKEEISKKGLRDSNFVLLAPEGYGSILEIASEIGLGRENVIFVKLDKELKMDAADLDSKLAQAKKENKKVVAVVAVAGHRDTGAIDPISEIAKITQNHKVRFHVDATSISLSLFDKESRQPLSGIEQADSVALDLFGYSAAFLKNATERGFLKSVAPYLQGLNSGQIDAENFGSYTEEGSREFEALRVWLTMKWMGTKNLGLWARLCVENAQMLRALVSVFPEFEVFGNPESPFFALKFRPIEGTGSTVRLPSGVLVSRATAIQKFYQDVAAEMQKGNIFRPALVDSWTGQPFHGLRISTLNPHALPGVENAFVNELLRAFVKVGSEYFGKDFKFQRPAINEISLHDTLTKQEIAAVRKFFVDPLGTNEDEANHIGKIICDTAIDYLAESRDAEKKILNHKSDEDLSRIFSDSAPQEPMSVDNLMEDFKGKIVANQLNLASPRYIAHMVTSPSAISLLTNMYVDSLNFDSDDTEGMQAVQFMHDRVVRWLGQMLGYQDSARGGIVTSGGTMANEYAMLAMRNAFFLKHGIDVQKIGFVQAQKELRQKTGKIQAEGVILVSGEAHYSWQKLGGYVGLGENQIIKIDVDNQMRMDVNDLKVKIAQAKAQDKMIMGVVGTAGTTETGNYDDLQTIGKIAENEKCWFHVDGAYGGLVSISRDPKIRALMDGAKLADSITIDPHKWLMMPYSIGAIVFKDKALLRLLEEDIQGTRRMFMPKGKGMLGSVSLYGAMQTYGPAQMAAVIDENIRLNKEFWLPRLQAWDQIEILNTPEINLLTFRYVPKSLQNKLAKAVQQNERATIDKINAVVNKVNVAIQAMLTEQGIPCVSYTAMPHSKYSNENPESPSNELIALRTALKNPFLNEEILEGILKDLRSTAAKVELQLAKEIKEAASANIANKDGKENLTSLTGLFTGKAGSQSYEDYLIKSDSTEEQRFGDVSEKGNNLLDMKRLGLPIPDFVIVKTQLLREVPFEDINFEALADCALKNFPKGLKSNFELVVRGAGVVNMPGILKTELEGITNKAMVVEALKKVYRSWRDPVTVDYLKANNIPQESGMAVIVQVKVHGDRGPDCAAGIFNTRTKEAGERKINGTYYINSQGDKTMTGSEDPDFKYLENSLEKDFPGLYDVMMKYASFLENYYHYPQQVEFTIEHGKLSILQTTDMDLENEVEKANMMEKMFAEGLIDVSELTLVLRQARRAKAVIYKVKENAFAETMAEGERLSEGAMDGILAFSLAEAKRLRSKSQKVILVVRTRTNELLQAIISREIDGFITLYGNYNMHDARIARAFKIPAISLVKKKDVVGNDVLQTAKGIIREGERVVIDGNSGKVLLPKEKNVVEQVTIAAIMDNSSLGHIAREIEETIQKEYSRLSYWHLCILNAIAAINVASLEQDKTQSLDCIKLDIASDVMHLMVESKGEKLKRDTREIALDMEKLRAGFSKYREEAEFKELLTLRSMDDLLRKSENIISKLIELYGNIQIVSVTNPNYKPLADTIYTNDRRIPIEFSIQLNKVPAGLPEVNGDILRYISQMDAYILYSTEGADHYLADLMLSPEKLPKLRVQDISLQNSGKNSNEIRLKGFIPFPEYFPHVGFLVWIGAMQGGAEHEVWLKQKEDGKVCIGLEWQEPPVVVEERVKSLVRSADYLIKSPQARKITSVDNARSLIRRTLESQVHDRHISKVEKEGYYIWRFDYQYLGTNNENKGYGFKAEKTERSYFYDTQAYAFMLSEILGKKIIAEQGYWEDTEKATAPHAFSTHYVNWLSLDKDVVDPLVKIFFDAQRELNMNKILGSNGYPNLEDIVVALYQHKLKGQKSQESSETQENFNNNTEISNSSLSGEIQNTTSANIANEDGKDNLVSSAPSISIEQIKKMAYILDYFQDAISKNGEFAWEGVDSEGNKKTIKAKLTYDLNAIDRFYVMLDNANKILDSKQCNRLNENPRDSLHPIPGSLGQFIIQFVSVNGKMSLFIDEIQPSTSIGIGKNEKEKDIPSRKKLLRDWPLETIKKVISLLRVLEIEDIYITTSEQIATTWSQVNGKEYYQKPVEQVEEILGLPVTTIKAEKGLGGRGVYHIDISGADNTKDGRIAVPIGGKVSSNEIPVEFFGKLDVFRIIERVKKDIPLFHHASLAAVYYNNDGDDYAQYLDVLKHEDLGIGKSLVLAFSYTGRGPRETVVIVKRLENGASVQVLRIKPAEREKLRKGASVDSLDMRDVFFVSGTGNYIAEIIQDVSEIVQIPASFKFNVFRVFEKFEKAVEMLGGTEIRFYIKEKRNNVQHVAQSFFRTMRDEGADGLKDPILKNDQTLVMEYRPSEEGYETKNVSIEKISDTEITVSAWPDYLAGLKPDLELRALTLKVLNKAIGKTLESKLTLDIKAAPDALKLLNTIKSIFEEQDPAVINFADTIVENPSKQLTGYKLEPGVELAVAVHTFIGTINQVIFIRNEGGQIQVNVQQIRFDSMWPGLLLKDVNPKFPDEKGTLKAIEGLKKAGVISSWIGIQAARAESISKKDEVGGMDFASMDEDL